jgi:hypothetical protein
MEQDIKLKSEIIKIQIEYNDKEDLKKIEENDDFRSFIYQKSLDIITQAIEDKKDKVELFNVINLSLIVEINSSEYESVLKKIQEHYIQSEDYDKCIEIQDIINKIGI